jgi:hypothetical protein
MLALHQTPTLIDCLLLKNCIRYCLAALANRFVRQQQRSEIMQCFAMFVNFFLSPSKRSEPFGGLSFATRDRMIPASHTARKSRYNARFAVHPAPP